MSKENGNWKPWEEYSSEEKLLQWLGIEKKQLDYLRQNRKFPYVRLTTKQRMYHLPSVCEWLSTNRIN
jgi:hypothetical protein